MPQRQGEDSGRQQNPVGQEEADRGQVPQAAGGCGRLVLSGQLHNIQINAIAIEIAGSVDNLEAVLVLDLMFCEAVARQ
jgi:hypothetical protein